MYHTILLFISHTAVWKFCVHSYIPYSFIQNRLYAILILANGQIKIYLINSLQIQYDIAGNLSSK